MKRLAEQTDCEIRFDPLTRQLYATDASIYRIEPAGAAFPRSVAQAAEVLRMATDAGISVIPRGAGTGLAGGAIGDGLVVDFARYNRTIHRLDLEKNTVHVGAGVVLDQLNDHLRPHGLCFGPDVATSSRATLGGMIANNSSGAHVPVYGTTVDHVVSLEVVLCDGTVATIGPDHDTLADQRTAIDRIIEQNAALIAERLPTGLPKRWPGYGLTHCLAKKGDLTRLITGSEGTLAGVMSAELKVLPLPKEVGLGVIFFSSISEAMQATVELLDLKPAAIEHIDRLLFDQTRGQLAFQAARSLLQLDEHPCESILLVEFFDHVAEKLAALSKRRIGLRNLTCTAIDQQALVWSVRKAGLSLVTGCKGPAKPTPGIEDVRVRPEQLPDYVDGLRSLLEPLGVEASYYGHAASGLLHVRPKLDLHTAEDVRKYRTIADGVSALCKQFNGSIAAEHGMGIARTEFLADHLGPELLAASRKIKQLFDPKNLLNPGKVIDDGRFKIDEDLRLGAGADITLPFAPVLGFVEKDASFVGNLEQCNGCGGCRKDTPTMCPTFLATGDEVLSTRGRANVIRAALEGRLSSEADPLDSPLLGEVLSDCLSCKACKTECPSNVDLALLKAELLHARHGRHGVALVDRLIASADRLGRLGCATAPLSNRVMRAGLVRRVMEKTLGLSTERPLPAYARTRFDHWFTGRARRAEPTRGQVVLWDDTWVRYHEPNVGIAAVGVLEAAGFEVLLPSKRHCCGRPAMSRGLLDDAAKAGRHNVTLLDRLAADAPVLFLEPSCYSMFVDDYRQLGLDRADRVAQRCVTFEAFLLDLLDREPDTLTFRSEPLSVAIHGHCHAEALLDRDIPARLVGKLPHARATVLDTACCGMAGSFGMMKDKNDLSRRVGALLAEVISGLDAETRLVASGTSCRHQITHLTDARPLHMAELLAGRLATSPG